VKVVGIRIATASVPVSPGIAPIIVPRNVPIKIAIRFGIVNRIDIYSNAISIYVFSLRG